MMTAARVRREVPFRIVAAQEPVLGERPTGPPRHACPGDKVAAELGTDPAGGLDEAEAAARFERSGPNDLMEAPPPPSFVRLGPLTNPRLLAEVGASFALQVVIVAVPAFHPAFGIAAAPTAREWALIGGLSLLPALIVESWKAARGRQLAAHRDSERVLV